MSADSPRRSSGSASRGVTIVPAVVPPQVVNDRSILDSAIGFINEVTLAHQPPLDPKDTITWARFETSADISDPRYGEDWELEGNAAPPLLLILGYGLGVQVWAIPANGEAVEVLSWRHGVVSVLKVLPTPLSTVADVENGRADEPIDVFGEKRPLIALVDGSSSSGSQPQFCAVNFVSLKTGAQVKTIKFKNPVIDILANRSSVVITFYERIAVFDARTLEDRLTITTCFPSPGINPNPAALGPRWLAYAENKLLHTKRSGGGCDGDGVASYTATVLNASKSLVKGLRELGEQVAAGLTGSSGNTNNSKNISFDSACGLDTKQGGVVTIIDIKSSLRDCSPTSGVPSCTIQGAGTDSIIAHFIAHSEAVVALEFDNSGMVLVTADRRGHDFHVFRIQPNPLGSSLAAVHHLYILHRGDTSAKVQNITLTLDTRWVAVSTLRGTTHVFPITPYGGSMGVRTHTSLHVVNKLSRFHRSAGLSGEGRSNSPISHSESTTFSQSLQPYNNSTLPPFPRPTVVIPLAQLRQPFALGSPPGSASLSGVKSAAGVTGSGSRRQRLSSLSDDSGKPLSVCAIFAKSRSWLLDPPNVTREAPHRMQRKAVDSLFIMAGHGALIQYDLDTKLASNIVKEKICDETPVELEVEAKAQWNLGRCKEGSQEITPPLLSDNWLIKNRNTSRFNDSSRQYDDTDDRTESWLSQVEIITHAGPHRRLWMGPQFVFKTYNSPSGSNLTHVDTEAVEIGTTKSSSVTNSEKLEHSNPLNMPLTAAGRSSAVPVLIESGSYSSIEQSPKLMDRFRHDHLDSDYSVAHGDSRLKEDLADAMRESPSAAASAKDAGGPIFESGGSSDNVAFYDALTAEDDTAYAHAHSASAAALASVLPNIHSYEKSSGYEHLDSAKKTKNSIEKIVNPLGTVTTISSCLADVKTDILDEVVSQLAKEETIIHENCDESLFRPVVAIFCDERTFLQNEEEARQNSEQYQPPEIISSKLVVPVIAKEVNDELSKREREKTSIYNLKTKVPKNKLKEQKKIEAIPFLNKKPKDIKKTKVVEGCGYAEDQGVETKSQKLKVTGSLADIKTKVNTEDSSNKKENEYSKSTIAFREISSEMEEAQKTKIKQETPTPGKPSKELPEQCDIKSSLRNNHDEKDSTTNIKEYKSEKSLSEIKKVDPKDLAKSKSEANVILTTDISNKSKTNIKEKLKKTKNSIHDLGELKKNVIFGATDKPPCIELNSNEIADDVNNLRVSKSENEIQKVNTERTNFQEKSKEQVLENDHYTDENSSEIKKLKKETLKETKQDAEPSMAHKSSAELKEVNKTSSSEQLHSDIFNSTEKICDVYSECIETANEIIICEEDDLIEKKVVIEKLENENDCSCSVKENIGEQNAKTVKIISNSDLHKANQNDLSEIESLTTHEANSELKKIKLPDSKTVAKSFENKIKTSSVKSNSPKKKGKESPKFEISTGKTATLATSFKNNEGNKECHRKKEIVREDRTKLKCDTASTTAEFVENTLNVCRNPMKDIRTSTSPILTPVSARKTVNGADIINKNLNKNDCDPNKCSLLGAETKRKTSDKLLPEIPTPADLDKETNLDELLVLESLDPLPPVPDLEPLKLMTENKSSFARDVSLITFESPLKESPDMHRKISPAPRGFTEQNLILALCGSLHFENEQVEKTEVSPTFSSNHSSSAFEETSLADYKSLTENDDPYISLEQSSQDTNTTTTNTNNEKFFSSTNSSGSDEIIQTEEKKMTRKQKRKKQQHQLKDFHKEEMYDEELRPLIVLTESQVYPVPESSLSFNKKQSSATQPVLYTTTTDSDGPLPTTTSDDNIFSIPVQIANNSHKIKTKKLEHKINLIAAIEAATSSSAEESGVELGAHTSNDNCEPLALESNLISTSSLPIPIASTSQTAVGDTQFYKIESRESIAEMSKEHNINKELNIVTSNSTTTSALKSQPLELLRRHNTSLKQDKNLSGKSSSSKHQVFAADSTTCQNVIDFNNEQHRNNRQQQLEYIRNNAIGNCLGNDGPSTLVNIDLFDDQFSTSSNSNTSRFSYEAAPSTATTPPIILNGINDTNLMHFTPSRADTFTSEHLCSASNRLSEISSSENNFDIPSTSTNYIKCDEDNISSSSSGSW